MKEQQELVHLPKQEVARRDNLGFGGVDVQSLIEKSIDSKSAVEVLERLMALRNQVKAENAKEAYDRALAAFQSECPIIVKRKAGYGNNYRYAPLDSIVGQVKELLKAHGFAFKINATVTEGWVEAVCVVKHEAGHSEESPFKCPIDNNQKNLMTTPQRYGGAMTFAKRYAFANAFGILTADEDKDAAPAVKPKGPKVATEQTRAYMIKYLAPIEQKALQYAIDKALIMPDQSLDSWPLAEVPTSAEGLKELWKEIEAHQ